MERKTYLDIAKGLSMICIFLGHLGVDAIDRVVYTFMVSVFFLITGYFINTRKNIYAFIIDKFKRLIIPYCFVSFVLIVWAVFSNEFLGEGIDSKGIAMYWIIAALFGTGGSDVSFMGQIMPSIGAIWFLLSAFFGAVMLRVLLEFRPWIRIILVFLILFISCYSTRYIFLPLSIQPAGVALFFMYVGYMWRSMEPYFEKLNKEFIVLVSIIAICCWLEAVIDFQWFLLVLAIVGRGMTDILRSICGCYVVFILSKLLDKNKVLRRFFSFIGEYSIIFLSVHLIELNFFPRNEIKYWLINIGMSEPNSFCCVVLFRFIITLLSVVLLSKWNVIRRIFCFSELKRDIVTKA